MTAPSAGGRREETVTLALLAAGALLLVVSAGQPWGSAVVTETGLPTLTVTATGREVAVEAAAAGVLALAGVAGLVATGRVGRMLVGLVLLLAGAVAVVVSWGFPARAAVLLDALLADRAGAAVPAATSTTVWWVVSAVGGAVVALCGAAAVVRGGRWPRMGSRYERTGEPSSAGAAPPSAGGAAAGDSASAWAALDRGEDPTV